MMMIYFIASGVIFISGVAFYSRELKLDLVPRIALIALSPVLFGAVATFLFWVLVFAAGFITRAIAGRDAEISQQTATHLTGGIYLAIAIFGVTMFRKIVRAK